MYGNRKLVLLLAMIALATSACETRYRSLQDNPHKHTVLAKAVSVGRLTKITFYGNSYLNQEKAQIYALYRSAEYAQLAKKNYFILYPTLYAASKGQYIHMPVVALSGVSPHAYSYVYLSDSYIPGAHKTSDVLQQYRSQLKLRTLINLESDHYGF